MSFRASKGWWLTSSTWVALVCTLPSSNDLETMWLWVLNNLHHHHGLVPKSGGIQQLVEMLR